MIAFLCGRLRCIECRASWGTVWNTQAPHPICHLCGGQCEPVGVQTVEGGSEFEIDAELFRLHVRAVHRVMS